MAYGIPCDVSQYELESARDVIKTRIQQIITERDTAKSLEARLIDEAYSNVALANPDVTREMVEQHWSASLEKALERIRGSRMRQALTGDMYE